MDIQELLLIQREIVDVLENGIIPFWFDRAWDDQHGGFLTNFDSMGHGLGTPEKYLNTQFRMVWWFSMLSHTFPRHKEFGQLAQAGVDWVIENFWDEKYGGWFWKVHDDGSELDDGKVVYGQAFAIYALAQHALSSGNGKSLTFASTTFDLLQKYCADTRFGGYYENLEREWQISPGGIFAGDRKSLDTHMHLMEAFTTLFAASNAHVHRMKLHEVIDLIVMYMLDEDTGCGRNQFTLNFSPIPAIAIHRTWNAEREGDSPKTHLDTTSYGHNIELAWLINRALDIGQIDPEPYRSTQLGLVEHTYAKGVDWDDGGIFRDGLADGEPVILEKEFWQHAESLVGFLDAYQTFQDEKYLLAFGNIWHFVKDNLINPTLGEFRTLLNHSGEVIDANLGNPWKVAYHTGRSMLECRNRLQAILKNS